MQIEKRSYIEFIANVHKYHQYEIIASNKLEQYFKTKHISYNDDKYYDIQLANGLLIEVKYDNCFNKYDTILIECCREKPSGISTTIANYWVIVNDTNQYYLIDTFLLKGICKNSSIKKLKYSYVYLIPKQTFIDSSILI